MDIFINCGCSGFRDSQTFPNQVWLVKTIKQRLIYIYRYIYIYIYEWRNECDTNTLRFIKFITFGFEDYLSKVPFKLRKYLINKESQTVNRNRLREKDSARIKNLSSL